MKKLFIIGSGGFSKQVVEIVEKLNIQSQEYDLIGLIDDNPSFIGKEVLGYKVVGSTDYLKSFARKHEVCGIIAIADGVVRKRIAKRLNSVKWINLIHPNTSISEYIKMGEGNVVCAGVTINPDCELGNHCHVNIGTTIGHDVSFNDYITVMPGSRISGNVTLKAGSTIGSGTTIIQGLTIEENVTLGAGCVVTKNTTPNSLYIGIPAKQVKKNE
jgi:sugar O-acyltransferase (sialic acid O-acetyltransferase NeuD family)